MPADFWGAVKQQLTELRTATSADDVLRILAPDRCPYRLEDPNWDGIDGKAEGFFAGGGGDDDMWDALDDAGWEIVWAEADYYYAMRAPNGDVITYVEGDVYRGDRRS